ncbi:hypothetical protein [Sulfodiicoccus acidiphilus]|nr:hypothetical protein [Sulfodiicoccus acidiphilus]
MDLLLMAELDEQTLSRIRSNFGVVNVAKRKLFISRGEEALVVSDRGKLRDAFVAARHYKRVTVYPTGDYGAAMELAGALREAGIDASIHPFEPTREEKGRTPSPPVKVRVGVILPEQRELLTWNVPEAPFFEVRHVRGEEVGLDVLGGNDCAHFPTYDVRTLIMKALLPFESKALTVEELTEDGEVSVKTPCQTLEGRVTLLRPNQWFTRFEIHEGEVRDGKFISFARRGDVLRLPLGMTFLAVLAPATAVSAILRGKLGFNA